ncbi:MAG TPA: M28 family peptidase [Isosphaeraceae bacterium]
MAEATRTGDGRRKTGLWVAIAAAVILAGVAVAAWPALRTSMAQSASTLSAAKVDGARAYGYLQAICKFGPRPAGSAANTRQREYVSKHFAETGATVREQAFEGADPVSGKQVRMANLIGSWFPERLDRVVLGANYDTRPNPDEDPDPAKRKEPFIGANDGASGVALLMEIANHLKDSKTPWGVDLVLFDGEELVYGPGKDYVGEFFLGSKAFAREYAQTQRNRKRGTPHYSFGIVLDMVGDKDLTVDQEQYSLEFAPKLVKDVWSVAKALKVTQFRDRVSRVAVTDDHLPLYNAGIPSIDIIDFDYPHWHTTKDVPENCSAASLEAVGKVVTAWLNKPKPRR